MVQGMRSNARAAVFLVEFLAALQVAMAASYIVGGPLGWTFPSTNNFYSDWAANIKLVPGDKLVFQYISNAHDVLEVSASDSTVCNYGSPIKQYASGNDVVILPKAGRYYYICGFPGHCDLGMSMMVIVPGPAAAPATPPPTPAAAPPPLSPPSSPPAAAPPPLSPPSSPPAAAPPPLSPPPSPPAAPPPPLSSPSSPPAAAPPPLSPPSAVPPAFTPAAASGSCQDKLPCAARKTRTVQKPFLYIVISVVTPLAVILIVGVILCLWHRKGKKNRSILEKEDVLRDLDLMAQGPREFTYKELQIATKSFSSKELLGRGGFGSVYRGTLRGTGTLVAVKQIGEESRQGEREFMAEVSIITKVRHRNLVQLHGWCREKSSLLLVYEYMPNGSLDNVLYEGTDDSHTNLGWSCRYNIVTGVAAALSYLHGEWEECILHRDIKPSNVLLDADLNPHLGDFGLALLVHHNYDAKTTVVAGTFGYMAPELPHTRKATMQSDGYSFGVLALEVVCGRRPLDMDLPDTQMFLLDVVWRAHESNNLGSVLDARLGCDYDLDEVMLILRIGLLCCHPDPFARPNMRTVGQVLRGASELPVLPTSRPILSLSGRTKDHSELDIEGHSARDATTSNGSSSNTATQNM